MKKWLWTLVVALPMAAAGVAYGQAVAKAKQEKPAPAAYTCPLTGEELPCPNCCPLKK